MIKRILNDNDIVCTVNKKKLTITGLLGAGAQGQIYTAQYKRKELLVKIFTTAPEKMIPRIKLLTSLRLYEKTEIFQGAPIDMINNDGVIGYTMQKAPGTPLAEIQPADFSLPHTLILCRDIAFGLSLLHKMSIWHGDIHPDNILVDKNADGIPNVYFIDLDNCGSDESKEIDTFTVRGHPHFLSPEIRKKFLNSEPSRPSIESDLFSFYVIMHTTLLFKSCFSDKIETPEEMHEALMKPWQGDYQADNLNKITDGYNSLVLSPEIANLIRTGYSKNPTYRPSAEEALNELSKGIDEVYITSCCNKPIMDNPFSKNCPYCGSMPERLVLICDHEVSIEIPIDTANVFVGRKELGGCKSIPKRQAIFSKSGVIYSVTPMDEMSQIISGKSVVCETGRKVGVETGDAFQFGNYTYKLVTESELKKMVRKNPRKKQKDSEIVAFS